MRLVAPIGAIALASLASGLVAHGAASHRPASDVLIEAKSPNGDFTCSGVYLGNGKVLTARHCMDDKAKYAVVLDASGQQGPATNAVWEWTSEVADVAVLRVEESIDATPAKLACRAAQIGESVELVGNPLGQTFIHTWGRVAGLSRAANKGADLDEFPIDASIAPGNSGGPAYDSAGRVLGIVNEGIIDANGGGIESPGRVNFAVSALEACEKYGDKHALPEPIAYLAHLFGIVA
jgi:S1-C subfamily serine protease